MYTLSPLALALALWLAATRPAVAAPHWLLPGALARLLAARLPGHRDVTLALLLLGLAGLLILKAAYGLHGLAGFLGELVLLLLAFGGQPERGVWSGLVRCLRDQGPDSVALLAGAGNPEITQSLYRGLLAPLVWYVLLGPVAAWIYRVASEIPPGAAAVRWPDWAPVRLTVLVMAMAGNFEETWEAWRQRSPLQPEPAALETAAAAAAGIRAGETGRGARAIVPLEEVTALAGVWGRSSALLAGGILLLWLAAGLPVVGG